MDEHDWPPDLTSDAKCTKCGQDYGSWSSDNPGCPPKETTGYACRECKAEVFVDDEAEDPDGKLPGVMHKACAEDYLELEDA